MFSYLRDKMRNGRITMCTNEVLWFVESLAPTDRNFALLKATEFRLLATSSPATFPMNDLMLKPGRSSKEACSALFVSLEEMYGQMLRHKAATEAQLRRMGVPADAPEKKVATELSAVRIWMATTGSRVNPATLPKVKFLWSMLLDGAEENCAELEARADRGELSESALSEMMASPLLDVDAASELLRKYRAH